MATHQTTNHDHPKDFACPQCQARYKIVRVAAEPGASHPTLQCKVCRQPLASTEGNDILKYFLVSRPRSSRPSQDANRPSAH
jgi:hypothetical protein